MSKSYRIRTQPGENGYLKVNLDLNQNYDFLEILSLKISQKDEYQNFCSEYGVIAGRLDINGGFGVSNAKVSIFVPLEESDLDNPVITSLYPYGDLISDPDKRNNQGLRYNLLPAQQKKLDHSPVGSFPSKRQILENGTTLEIYEKYYKYTTTTNDAGDYILFGVPVGEHTIHYDVDVSDIGFISARPYEMIADGYSEELFDSRFKFRSSNNIDTLPQIFTVNEKITVEPYWCDNLSGGNPIGINRKDFSIDVNLTPTAIFTGSIFSDDEKDSLNKNCRPDRDMGKMAEVITGGGTIEAIRRTPDGTIETYEINGDTIDDNGNWSIMIPMNLRKVITDEFGNVVPSPDGIKGIPTEADFRFRISMDKSDSDKRLRQRAHFLVPNMTGNYNFKEYSKESLETSDDFKINEQLSTVTTNTPYEDEKSNQYNYLEEFFTFRWKKVYTVKQYIGRYQKLKGDETRAFIGIKDIFNGEGVNKFPANRLDSNFNPLYTIICFLLGLFASIVGIINGILQIINGLVTMLCQVRIPVGICASSEKGSVIRVRMTAQQGDGDGGWTETDDGPGDCDTHQGGDHTRCGRVSEQNVTLGRGSNKRLCVDTTALGGSDPADCAPIGISDVEFRVINAATPNAKIQSMYYDPTDPNCASGCWKNIDNQFISAPYNGATATAAVATADGNLHFYAQSSSGIGYFPRYLVLGNGSSDIVGNNYCTGSPSPGGWTYNYSGCVNSSDPSTGCRRFRTGDGQTGDWWDDSKCNKCNLPSQSCDGIKIFGVCWTLKFKCLLSGLICRKCNGYCEGDKHGCCPSPEGGQANAYDFDKCPASCGSGKCCKECCIKVPLIALSCEEENLTIKPTLIPTPFAPGRCNKTWVIPGSCTSCGGASTPLIKDWVACKMEPIAVFLKMLKFDFYNDWVNGSLYFPLIKRKYKLKKSKKKFGQIKKDKFCQFNCFDEYQGNGTYPQQAIIIKPTSFYNPVTVEISGCKVTIDSPIASEWYGEDGSNSVDDKNKAAQDIILHGRNTNNDRCQIQFDDFATLNTSLSSINELTIVEEVRQAPSIYSKPDYVKITDQFGNETWENQGGFGLNKNRCDRTRLSERKEFFKTSLDCETSNSGLGLLLNFDNGINTEVEYDENGDPVIPGAEDGGEDGGFGPEISGFGSCLEDLDACAVKCGANGVAACNLVCPCNNYDTVYDNYGKIMRHGLITWSDRKLYYSSIITKEDEFNTNEYKGNLMLPTTITELGSTSFCDIDGAPFIMDTLQPTTFQVSMEAVTYKYGSATSTTRQITGNKDKEGGLNLRAYASFSCTAAECFNSFGTVNQSQIGVETIDTNDIDVAVGPCYLRFSHDVDIREYFCRRFSGYKDGDLNVHYVNPSNDSFDNQYNEYPEMRITDGLTYEFNEGGPIETIPSEYNDGDLFVPGDACGFKNNDNVDYFYGLAPGRTDSLVNFPNTTPIIFSTNQSDTEDINTEQTTFTDISDSKGIRFNRSQTPYHFYFGIIPGKTALHKTVGKFFADKINVTTLQGVGSSPDDTSAGEFGQNNIRNQVDNPFSILKTCLGQTQLPNPPIP